MSARRAVEGFGGGMREKGGTRQRENCCGVDLGKRAKERLCGHSQHGAADDDNDDGG